MRMRVPAGAWILPLLILASCSDDPAFQTDDPLVNDCNLSQQYLADGGVGRDGIPALTDPPMVPGLPLTRNNGYVLPTDRVIGLVLDGQAFAVPHNVLWVHEILNFNHGDHQLVITYCPLTGSSIVYDRSAIDGDEFGVSGLLYQNNLIMYNRRDNESLWPQMMGQARCGPDQGRTLQPVAALEMTWEGWLDLYPGSLVVSGEIDPFGDYQFYPYGDYEALNRGFFFPMPDVDGRRWPKERVLGIPGGGGGIAFPFLTLNDVGAWAAVEVTFGGREIVVFWDRDKISAQAYLRSVDGAPVSFTATEDGIFDVATETRWDVNGAAVEGDLLGSALVPLDEAYVAFWGAWAAFFPATELWEG